jgi:quercetin dioxygenase-like cupin family protein
MKKGTPTISRSSNYQVKSVEPVMVGSDMQARLFTLAPGDTIPWHLHRESVDHYFVLAGALTVMTRDPEEASTIVVGSDHRIVPGTAHQITNRSDVDCRFLLLQGVGRYDWVKIDDG